VVSFFFSFWTILAAALVSGCASKGPPEFDEEAWLAQVRAEDPAALHAPHVDGDGRFFNPWLPRSSQPRRKGGGSFFFRKKPVYPPFPEERYGPVANDYAYLRDKTFDSITFAGHASVIIKMDGETVFTDPFFSGAAVIVPKKVNIHFDYGQVPEKPVVLISHNHYDHLDKATVKKLIKKEAVFIVPLRMGAFFTRLGAAEVHELDWWETLRRGPLTYTLLPAQHWSRRLGQAGGEVLWGSFLIQGSRTVYFSGDTGYFCGFKEYGARYRIDYAILGAGAYEPRWFMHYSHMSPQEMILAAGDLNARVTIPMHFGVISLSDEPLVYPLYVLDQYLAAHPEAAPRFAPLRVGEHLRLF